MRIALQDVSPSAQDRGGDNDVHFLAPSEIHSRIERGTVWVHLFQPGNDTNKVDVSIQFWEGWINQVQTAQQDEFCNRAKELLAPWVKGKHISATELEQLLIGCGPVSENAE